MKRLIPRLGRNFSALFFYLKTDQVHKAVKKSDLKPAFTMQSILIFIRLVIAVALSGVAAFFIASWISGTFDAWHWLGFSKWIFPVLWVVILAIAAETWRLMNEP